MARLKLSRAASFWLLATLFAFFLFAAGAPSPLYVVYEAMWHFSSLTLTAIFGVYALALLAALLTTGRLSDHLGRRPGPGGSDRQYGRLHRRKRRGDGVSGAGAAGPGDRDRHGRAQRLAA